VVAVHHGHEIGAWDFLSGTLGDWRLQDLDSTAIKAFYTSLTTLAPRTVHRVHNTLHRALEDAVEDRLISRNPADKAHTEPEADHHMITWTADELATFSERSVRIASTRCGGSWP
jgi:hypothetical protein